MSLIKTNFTKVLKLKLNIWQIFYYFIDVIFVGVNLFWFPVRAKVNLQKGNQQVNLLTYSNCVEEEWGT